jgi:hypothetical protein
VILGMHASCVVTVHIPGVAGRAGTTTGWVTAAGQSKLARAWGSAPSQSRPAKKLKVTPFKTLAVPVRMSPPADRFKQRLIPLQDLNLRIAGNGHMVRDIFIPPHINRPFAEGWRQIPIARDSGNGQPGFARAVDLAGLIFLD